MNAIEISHISKRFGAVAAVNDLNLSVCQGELFSLLGLNGAGKTTTIKILSGLLTPDSGETFLEGISVQKDPADAKSILAVSPQETAIAPNLTVRENLRFICGIHGLSRQRTEEKTAALSRQLGLDPVLDRRAGKLSGGYQRRLSIAMALISEPRVLFLDEPTLGLDVVARRELWDVIRHLHGRITILLTTHYMEEAQALSDRVGILAAGQLRALGTPQELQDRTATASLEEAFLSLVKKEGAQ